MQVANTLEAQSNFKVFSKLLDVHQEAVLTWAQNIESILEVQHGLSEPDIDRVLEDTIEQLAAYGHDASLVLLCANKESLCTAAAWIADMTPYGQMVRDLWLNHRLAALVK